jgi:hypothetical protein
MSQEKQPSHDSSIDEKSQDEIMLSDHNETEYVKQALNDAKKQQKKPNKLK